MFRIPPPYLWTPLSPQRVKGCSPLTIPKMRSKPKNASRFAKRIFFCASPIYGSAEDFTFLLDVTVSREVTPAAKQQIGETRKKCNSDDRRLRRIQGGAVGAAVSRMQAAAKQTLGTATRLSAATSFFPFRLLLWGLKGASSPFLATATTAACGGNREELLGPRSAGHECRPRHEVDAGYRNPSPPARRNRWWFSGSLLTSKENISLNANAL